MATDGTTQICMYVCVYVVGVDVGVGVFFERGSKI